MPQKMEKSYSYSSTRPDVSIRNAHLSTCTSSGSLVLFYLVSRTCSCMNSSKFKLKLGIFCIQQFPGICFSLNLSGRYFTRFKNGRSTTCSKNSAARSATHTDFSEKQSGSLQFKTRRICNSNSLFY